MNISLAMAGRERHVKAFKNERPSYAGDRDSNIKT